MIDHKSTATPKSRLNTQPSIVIVGAGIAGSVSALLLARQGYGVSVVDPREIHPPDFRCEKFNAQQMMQIRALGLEDILSQRATRVEEVIIARSGRVVDQINISELYQRYEQAVNSVRASWPANVTFHTERVETLKPTLTLGSGQTLAADLIILATGPGEKLRASLGLKRRIIRENHSICIGFDLVTKDGQPLSQKALTHYGEQSGDGMGYATLFPFPNSTRVNLFSFLEPKSPIIHGFRKNPLESLYAVMPGLRSQLGDAQVAGASEIRITHLYIIDEPACDRVVLIGDAQHSSCPATGTGVTRVLSDADRLCNHYIPQWLKTPGMGVEKIALFYADPLKCEVDSASARRAEIGRDIALGTNLAVRMRRASSVIKSMTHHALVGPRGSQPFRQDLN